MTSGNLGTNDYTVGGDFDTWGTKFLQDLAIFNKFAGDTHIVTDTSGNVVLTTADCQCFSIQANGSGATIVNIRVPDSIARYHYLRNDRASGQITYRCAAGGTAITLDPGDKRLVYSDGTNCADLTLLTTSIAAVSGLQAALDAKQPLDADLTAIAALATTSYGRALLTAVDGASLAALVDAYFLTPTEGNAAYQPLDSDLSAIAALTTTTFGRALLALADAAALTALLTTVAKLDTEDQVVTGGARITIKDLGALSAAASNTITPDPGDRPTQSITNDHAGSILPGSNAGDYLLEVNNTTGAGAITTTGWTLKGDTFDTTTTSKFLCSCHVTANQKVMSITKVA